MAPNIAKHADAIANGLIFCLISSTAKTIPDNGAEKAAAKPAETPELI